MMRVVGVVLCAGLFVLMSEDASLKNWIAGAAIGALLGGALPAAPRVGALTTLVRRLIAFPWFLLGAVGQVAQGCFEVGRVLTVDARKVSSAIVEVESPTRSETAAQVLALVFSASPGTVVLNADHERGRLTVHLVECRSRARVEASVHRFYNRHQRWCFP